MTINILGIDIAKSTFQLHGADNASKAVLKKRLPRHKLAAYVSNLSTCTIVMESCGGANYWGESFPTKRSHRKADQPAVRQAVCKDQ